MAVPDTLPPPSLEETFTSLSFGKGESSDGGKVRVSFDGSGENRRSSPDSDRDPEGAITSFIENLLNPDHADTQPHLLAIGYELEALVSIYTPSAVRLSTASRPPSWNPEDHPDHASYALPEGHDADTPPSSAAMTSSSSKRDSRAWLDALKDYNSGLIPTERIRYEVNIPAWESGESLQGVEEDLIPDTPPVLRVLVSLPPTYPDSSPPQLQLLGRYVGSFPIDAGLFGDITRTYISSSGVAFTPGDVCIFEGLTHVQNLARTWYAIHLSSGIEGEKVREAERKRGKDGRHAADLESEDPISRTSSPGASYAMRPSGSRATFSYSQKPGPDDSNTPQTVHNAQEGLPAGFVITSSEPLVEKRSTFVGHAVRVTDEREVPLVIHELLDDRKIAKASHPAIFAYRIAKDVGGAAGKVFNSDYDDDGETQAGARLKHLLEILELENVLVVVSRWYGGTHLGPDRFKLINQAARDALELGGFLEEREKETAAKGKGKKK